MNTLKTIVAATAGLSMLAVTGCVVRPYHERAVVVAQPAYVDDDPYDGEVYASEQPPAPQVEDPGPPPGPDVVWVGGIWVWGGGHYVWRGGHWGHPPHSGAVWVHPEWARGPHGWERHRGYWR